jgi:protein-S-isoprenylcysteine O-methyltransferase Ste14
MRRMNAAIGTVVFFVLAPGVVAGAIPWWLTGWEVGMSWPTAVRACGAVLTAAGVVVLMQAFARFVREGRGTPAPVAPTETLVVGGLYRFVRNPMYLAVLATIVGRRSSASTRSLTSPSGSETTTGRTGSTCRRGSLVAAPGRRATPSGSGGYR